MYNQYPVQLRERELDDWQNFIPVPDGSYTEADEMPHFTNQWDPTSDEPNGGPLNGRFPILLFDGEEIHNF